MNALLAFMIANFCVAVLVFAGLNFVVGVTKSWQDNTFSLSKALNGVKDIVLLAIGLSVLGMLFFILKDLQVYGLPFAEATFKLITTLAIAYYGNSVLQNALPLLKMPTPAFLKTIDDKVKEMFNRTDPLGSFVSDQDIAAALKESEIHGED